MPLIDIRAGKYYNGVTRWDHELNVNSSVYDNQTLDACALVDLKRLVLL
jgi:hypothetical protein